MKILIVGAGIASTNVQKLISSLPKEHNIVFEDELCLIDSSMKSSVISILDQHILDRHNLNKELVELNNAETKTYKQPHGYYRKFLKGRASRW